MDIKTLLKKPIRIVLDVLLLLYGLIYYFCNTAKPIHERTPPNSYLSMIRLFCLTKGWSNDILTKCISLFDKPLKLPDYKGILGNFNTESLKNITQELEDNGYYIFDQKLPTNLVEALYEFAANQECVARRLDDEEDNSPPRKGRYDKTQLTSSVYDIPLDSSLANPIIQSLLIDHSILGVAQSYLKTSPKIDPVAFWWSTSFSKDPQINSAQLFHFDMDRIKWLKFFFFLTDVTLENGPHVFVKKSQQTGAIPRELLKAGYSRHTDEAVNKYFPVEDIKVFTVPRGTILVEDTRGLHKGTHLIKGDRLVLELQYSNCLFGAITPAIQTRPMLQPKLTSFVQNYRRIFKLFPI